GMLNDLISTGIFNQDTSFITIVAQARRAYPDNPQFRVLAAPDSGISEPADLAGVDIAISENSIIHYITQRILEDAGLSAADLSYRAEPNIPVRFQLLLEGQLQVATLPDPLAQAAIDAGAILVADDTALVETEYSQSVLSFRTDVVVDEPEAVQGFVTAWMQAAEDINADPEAYRDLWQENTNVPDSVRDTYVLPPFPTYAITGEMAWDDTIQWLLNEDIVDGAASYAESVDATFVDAIRPAETAMALPGDPAAGEVVYNNNGCIGCHALDDTAGVGPGLAGIGVTAATRVEGQSAEEYLRQTMLEPNAYVVENYQPIMPPYDSLSDDDLNNLIAYLLTFE
ncbi:MAG: c-type cytochrome, partial [Chloroflexi bacterium]|nr:c-type cytochrome [Chloroflexota bacterium]